MDSVVKKGLLCNLGSLSQELRLFQFYRPKMNRVRAKTCLTGQRDRRLPVSYLQPWYIPLKRARFGVKSFMLCEDSGYTFSFKIYTGKENTAPAVQELSLSERVVADLMQPLLQKGYHLYTDNWYTSLPLYKYLHRQGTLACGTIRSNRKGFPVQMKNAKLRRDEQIACRSDELLAVKFKDKKDVYMLSTIHDDSMVHRPDRRHRNQRQTKPTCIADYNKYMGGVDRTD